MIRQLQFHDPDRCPLCGEPHHGKMELAGDPVMGRPDVGDLTWHVNLAAYPGITDRLEVHSPEWIAAFEELNTYVGYLSAAVAHYARDAEAAEVMEKLRRVLPTEPGTYTLVVLDPVDSHHEPERLVERVH